MEQQINLLDQLPKPKSKIKGIAIVISSYIGFVLLLFIWDIYNSSSESSTALRYSELKKSVTEKQNEVLEMTKKFPALNKESFGKSITKLKSDYQDKLNALDLLSYNKNFSKYLLGFAETITDDVWLNIIFLERNDTSIKLTGLTTNRDKLQEFYHNLTLNKTFEAINFDVSEIKQDKNPANFIITGRK